MDNLTLSHLISGHGTRVTEPPTELLVDQERGCENPELRQEVGPFEILYKKKKSIKNAVKIKLT